MNGRIKAAQAVIEPSKTNTGIAENMHPFPSEQVITRIITKSSTDFAARIDQSPLIPSWIAPTIAIAPIETVSDAVTNPSTKSLAFALPVFLFSHSPNLSNTVHRLTEIIKQLYNPANHALNSMNPHHCGM